MAKIYELEAITSGSVYTLEELCQRRSLEAEFVVQCVEVGITEVSGSRREQWLFPVGAAHRLEKAFRLRRDLDLDFTALALVLDLLDDIDQLHGRIDRLNQRLGEWESG